MYPEIRGVLHLYLVMWEMGWQICAGLRSQRSLSHKGIPIRSKCFVIVYSMQSDAWIAWLFAAWFNCLGNRRERDPTSQTLHDYHNQHASWREKKIKRYVSGRVVADKSKCRPIGFYLLAYGLVACEANSIAMHIYMYGNASSNILF